MARTVDTKAQAVRRDAFVDAAWRLLQVKGYEQMSIQDVLAETDASRGAFYHYFESKTALLDAVVHRLIEKAVSSVIPIVEDPELTALPKFERLFGGIAQWNTERTELILSLTTVWLSDENALTREKMWRHTTARLSPLLATVLRQGVEEGVFDVASPDDSARVVVALVRGMNDAAVRVFAKSDPDSSMLAEIEGAVRAYIEALERILGVSTGTLTLIDRSALEEWFA